MRIGKERPTRLDRHMPCLYSSELTITMIEARAAQSYCNQHMSDRRQRWRSGGLTRAMDVEREALRRSAPPPDAAFNHLLSLVLSPDSPIYDISVPKRRRPLLKESPRTTRSPVSAASLGRHPKVGILISCSQAIVSDVYFPQSQVTQDSVVTSIAYDSRSIRSGIGAVLRTVAVLPLVLLTAWT